MNNFEKLPRGTRLFRNTGDLSFETRPRSAGTYPVTFLEPVDVMWSKIINQHGRVEVVHNNLLSGFNL